MEEFGEEEIGKVGILAMGLLECVLNHFIQIGLLEEWQFNKETGFVTTAWRSRDDAKVAGELIYLLNRTDLKETGRWDEQGNETEF
jgi:hypothetical protein